MHGTNEIESLAGSAIQMPVATSQDSESQPANELVFNFGPLNGGAQGTPETPLVNLPGAPPIVPGARRNFGSTSPSSSPWPQRSRSRSRSRTNQRSPPRRRSPPIRDAARSDFGSTLPGPPSWARRSHSRSISRSRSRSIGPVNLHSLGFPNDEARLAFEALGLSPEPPPLAGRSHSRSRSRIPRRPPLRRSPPIRDERVLSGPVDEMPLSTPTEQLGSSILALEPLVVGIQIRGMVRNRLPELDRIAQRYNFPDYTQMIDTFNRLRLMLDDSMGSIYLRGLDVLTRIERGVHEMLRLNDDDSEGDIAVVEHDEWPMQPDQDSYDTSWNFEEGLAASGPNQRHYSPVSSATTEEDLRDYLFWDYKPREDTMKPDAPHMSVLQSLTPAKRIMYVDGLRRTQMQRLDLDLRMYEAKRQREMEEQRGLGPRL